MKFYTIKRRASMPKHALFPCCTLSTDNWNDQGFKTLFYLKFYFDKENFIDLGGVKILKSDSNFTTLEDEFSDLTDEFCSLGQSVEFYEKLKKEIPDYIKILTALNDVVYNDAIYQKFREEEAFRLSLLRFSEAETALEKGRKVLFDEYTVPEQQSYRFAFQMHSKYPSEGHSMNFMLSSSDTLPSRINVIIGKNGSGKTQFLSKLANVVSGWKPEDGTFDQRPNFSKIIAISYSPFDEFDRPEKNLKDKRTFSYIYCGIRDQEGNVNLNAVKKRWHETYKIVFNSAHKELYFKIILRLLENENIKEELIKNPGSVFKNLSSGHKITLIIITDLLATLSEDSLVLLDEPESYLHPNLLSEFILSLEEVLEKTRSFAIISTHSPVILQEIPAHCVQVMLRSGNLSKSEPLKIESFGENISILTEEVFKVSRARSNWKKRLKELRKRGLTYQEILSLFEQELSINAKLYLKSLEGEVQ